VCRAPIFCQRSRAVDTSGNLSSDKLEAVQDNYCYPAVSGQPRWPIRLTLGPGLFTGQATLDASTTHDPAKW